MAREEPGEGVPPARVELLWEVPLPAGADADGLRALIDHVLAAQTVDVPSWEINILLTTDEKIAQFHQRFMGIPGPTDIITFETDLEPGEAGLGGDIVISVETAARQGPVHGQSVWDEVRFLVVHGLLHLVGFDDATPDERNDMLLEQKRLIQEFDARRR
jgi:probable rRNA maturation factor